MARKMCNFGNIGRVRRWETRIFVVVFICIACHSVTNSEIVPRSIAATGHRAETGGNGRDTRPWNNREPTTTSSMQCHTCANKQTNAECNALEVEYCGSDQESCQTELRYSNYRLSITKQCKQKLACEYATHNNSVDCEGLNISPVCFYCCQGSRCNRDLPINPLNQLVDPRALYILMFEVLYNTSQPTPVTNVCGEFYAQRFLEKFVSAQQKLNVNCPIVNVKVDVKAMVRLYGNKVEVNTYINLSNTEAYTPERHFNNCANLLRNVLKGYDAFESQVCTSTDVTRRSDCFSVIPATNSDLQCSQAQMSPRQFTEKRSKWKCPKNLIFDGASKKCRSQVTKTTTTPPMTAETTTSSTPQSTTTNVEIVSPLNMTSSASDMSVVTPERATVSDKPVTVAVYLTTPTETETSPMATTEYMVTQTLMTSWGIEVLNQSRQLLLLEGGDTKNVYFRLWANKTELCGGSEETCSLSLQFSVLPGDSAKTPRCRSTDVEIPQVVVGRPSWVTSSSHDYCSMSGLGDTTDDVNVLPLKAVLDWKYDDSQTQYLQVTLNVSRDGEVGIEDRSINVLPIKVVDRDRKSTCQSINDPHVTTFDGLEYNNFYEGEFVLYRHADLPFSVHAIYQQCGHLVSASCNCAVAVQSGDDVVVIDRCMRKRKPFRRLDGSVDKNPVTVMSVDLYLNGQLTPGTRIYEDSDGKKYFIYLPHGAYVKVMVSGLLVNVWIVPSPSDIGHTKGLCGTYDWNKTNEFNLRNGSVLEQPDKEEGKRPQPHVFILDWQVDLYGDDTIFRGVKKGGELFTLQRYCTCVSGQPGICSYSHDISTCDIYQGQDVTDQFIVNAINLTTSSNTRKKRAINENSVLKTNEPIVINKGFIPKDTHPWKYGWNETYAKKFCSDYIRDKYPLGQLCSQIPGVNFDQEIITCVEDIHIIGDDSWADSAREAMKEQCLDEIQKNGNLPRNITQQIEGSMCTNDCSGHGNCVNGKCHCEIGYTSADCSAKVKQPPYKVELNKYGLCDRRYMSCDAVIVYGMNFVQSPTLKCSLQKCQVLGTSQAPILLGKPTLLIAQFINFNAVECPIPSHNQSYIINVTNNGKIYSEGLLFIPFDSRCNDCSTNTTTCVKKRNSCIIDGECYEDKGFKGNNNDSCEVCKPYNNEYSWTTLQVPRCRPPWWQSVPDWVVALVAAVGGSLVGLLVGFLLYRCCCKSRRKPDPAQEVALDNQTDIVASSPFEDHMLHRNRGLPAYSGGGDQFADLTLRQPDYEETYFYNDGRGVENGIDSNTYFY